MSEHASGNEVFGSQNHVQNESTAPKKRGSSRREMPLSCQRCRLRKVKCNFAHPCSSCVKLGVECIAVPNDMRKRRPPANYVSTLEKQIDAYSKFVLQLQKLETPEERSRFFDANFSAVASTSPAENDGQLWADQDESASAATERSHAVSGSEEPSELPPAGDSAGQKSARAHSPAQNNKIRPVYGPTSVYENDADFKSRSKSKSVMQKKESRELALLQSLSRDPDVLHCLKLFFTWQYPNHNMFVFREAFFIDFFHPKPNSLYCSSELVLSICALGARMSDVDSIYSRSITYYNEAKSSILSNLEHPSITSVQSFLLLAFYDICNGHNSTGWMLSGNAMRMGFDLGFQLNPEVWFLKHRGALQQLDVSIRSRIYWGCFMADHFISLVLGRPSLLKLSDATIPETEDLPELDWIDEYKYVPENVTNISDPLKNIINLISISDNMLNDIFTRSDNLSSDESTHDDYDLVSRLSKLFDYNAQIQHWKENLPSDLNWDRENLKVTSDNPTISVVRYYYYILILCLNRPFVGITRDFKEKAHLSPAFVCSNAIEDLYIAIQKFERAHGLRRASIFIVYCSILSISVILLTSTTSVLDPEKKLQLKYFLNVLAGCSKTWRLAEKSHKMIAMKLRLKFADDPDFKIAVPEVKKARARRQKKTASDAEIKAETTDNVEARNTNSVNAVVPENYTGMAAAISLDGTTQDDAQENTALDDELRIASAELEQMSNMDQASTEFFGGPPVLMTSDLFNEDWEALFPDSIFSHGPSQ
ncbi:hypothetical protein OXX80_008869 [Metschnikowia pulcherrima]